MSPARFESRGGRRVVLKPLDQDCLLDGALHPSIRLRLERVRELPVTAVANLHGVQPIEGRAFLVWDHVDGAALADAAPRLNDEQRAAVRREISLAVDAMHAAGVVHGAIHERNVILDHRGLIRLTHVSPLLYDDPEVDHHALADMFDRLGFGESPSNDPGDRETAFRVRAVVAASLVLLAGVIVAALIGWYAGGSS